MKQQNKMAALYHLTEQGNSKLETNMSSEKWNTHIQVRNAISIGLLCEKYFLKTLLRCTYTSTGNALLLGHIVNEHHQQTTQQNTKTLPPMATKTPK